MSKGTVAEGQFLTLPQIAALEGVRHHVARYAIEEYGPPPTWRIGGIRAWARSQLPEIERALARSAANQRGYSMGRKQK